MADAINKMYDKMSQVNKSLEAKTTPMEDAIFNKDEGLSIKFNQITNSVCSTDCNLESLMEENVQLRDEIGILRGIVHKLSNQPESTNSKVNQLVARSMEDNLIFTGILEELPNRNPRKQLHNFFCEELGVVNIRDADLLSVFRLGQKRKE